MQALQGMVCRYTTPLDVLVCMLLCLCAARVASDTSAVLLRQMFTRKFERLAASYSDAVFCDILGDENNDTRVRYSASQHPLASLS